MTVALDAALSGLRVAQQALDVTSTNIANASTPGYTRKILPQETIIIGGQGMGADGTAITRYVDKALLADLNRQTAVAESYNIIQKYLSRIQDFQGASDVGRSLSAQVTSLANTFTQLSAAPDDQTLLAHVVATATQTATKINNFAQLITDMRNGTEADIESALDDINQALDTIARLNVQIVKYSSSGQTTAALEDQRDLAIKTVAKYIDISTFPNDGQLVVITKQGETLADSSAHHLFFQKSTILPVSYYPGGGLNGIRAGSPGGTDITPTGLGGQLGALFELRDEILPGYTAQMDEFAQKLADRFQSQGLTLFTDLNGNVPPNVAPPGITGYSGFSTLIQVNSAVALDTSLIRNGTTGNTEASGSNEVIRRIAQFTFGAYQYQQATGTVDISVGPLVPLLGLTTPNTVVGSVNIATYAPDLSSVPGLVLPASFTLTIGGVPQAINILATDDAADLVNTINTAFGSTVAALNSGGRLAIFDDSDIDIADGTIGAAGMAALGFNFGTTVAPDPSFQVQVGTRPPVTITIAPLDTSVELLAQLNAVTGLTATLGGTGELVLTPTDGGDLKVTDTLGGALAAMGVTLANVAHTAFRQNNLGPDGSLSTGLLANSTLQDYISSIITAQGEDANSNLSHQSQETAYLQTLDSRNANASGVNIDQEMSDLIRIQSAYAAAARMVTATRELFDDLLNAVR